MGARPAGWLEEFGVKGRERDGCRSCSWRLLSCYRLVVSARPEAGSGDTQVGVAEGLNWRGAQSSAAVTSAGRWRGCYVLQRWSAEAEVGWLGLLGGRDSEFRPVASACIPGRQNCVLASSQRSASRTPVSRIAHWTRSSTARVFAWPSPFRASPTFSRSAELVGGCRQVGVRVRGLYP